MRPSSTSLPRYLNGSGGACGFGGGDGGALRRAPASAISRHEFGFPVLPARPAHRDERQHRGDDVDEPALLRRDRHYALPRESVRRIRASTCGLSTLSRLSVVITMTTSNFEQREADAAPGPK